MARKEKRYPNGYTSKELQNYKKEHYKEVHLFVPKDDYEVIKKLESVKSKNGYILSLIRQDIEMNG